MQAELACKLRQKYQRQGLLWNDSPLSTQRVANICSMLSPHFLLIIIFAPLMGLIAILIKITSRGAVFFSHKRVGLNNELFVIHKFRSLHVDTPSYSEKPGAIDRQTHYTDRQMAP